MSQMMSFSGLAYAGINTIWKPQSQTGDRTNEEYIIFKETLLLSLSSSAIVFALVLLFYFISFYFFNHQRLQCDRKQLQVWGTRSWQQTVNLPACRTVVTDKLLVIFPQRYFCTWINQSKRIQQLLMAAWARVEYSDWIRGIDCVYTTVWGVSGWCSDLQVLTRAGEYQITEDKLQ